MTLDENKDRARALMKQGRTEEAVAAWEAIAAVEPKDGNVWWSLGCAYRTAKLTEKSVMAHRESVKLCPRGAVIILRRIKLLACYLLQAVKSRATCLAAEAWDDLREVNGRLWNLLPQKEQQSSDMRHFTGIV